MRLFARRAKPDPDRDTARMPALRTRLVDIRGFGCRGARGLSMRLWSSAILASDTQLNQNSYYEATVTRAPATHALQGAVDADVLVVGAGFAGLSAAIELAQRGYSVVVLEAERICSGASGRNGGQALVGFACGQQTLEAQLGRIFNGDNAVVGSDKVGQHV